MRNLSEAEILSLSQLLKLEQDGLAVARTMQMLITGLWDFTITQFY